MKLYWHTLIAIIIFAFAYALMPEIGIMPLVLLIMADVFIDMDHLIKFKSISKVIEQYGKCMDYPFHKLWVMLPLAVLTSLTYFWFGMGILVHLILDFAENQIIFKGRFKWL